MAKLNIAEFMTLGDYSQGGAPQVMQLPPLTEQNIAIGGTSAQSAAFGATTRFIRIEVDAICSIACGTNPTATTSNMRFAADQTEYFGVQPGHKLAVITNT